MNKKIKGRFIELLVSRDLPLDKLMTRTDKDIQKLMFFFYGYRYRNLIGSKVFKASREENIKIFWGNSYANKFY